MNAILGISAYYHDSAATILVDGKIIAAASEERFTRIKNDPSFPVNAIKYVLLEAGLELADLTAVAFYDKSLVKFERLIETYHSFAPSGLKSFLFSMPAWVKEKLFIKKLLRDELAKIGVGDPKLLFPEHHLSHAASAFYPSPFKESAILTIDGVGEWATTTIGYGKGKYITVKSEMHFPHSLGLLYSAFTGFCGFKVNSGEYKLMGLASYGNFESSRVLNWEKQILEEIVDLRDDGSFFLNMDYFNYAVGLEMCNEKKFTELFGIKKREPDIEITQDYMDLAMAIQHITEEVVIRLAISAKKITNSNNLVMAGGVALNCVVNGKLLKEKVFDNVWIQPAAGDAGGALGAAYAAFHIWHGGERKTSDGDMMQGGYLGPEFSSKDILRVIKKNNATFVYYSEFSNLCKEVGEQIARGKIVGWFQGRMEYGPRALGNRSILADPRNSDIQKRLNLKIKKREAFRPFAPSIIDEEVNNYFDLEMASPYMLIAAPVILEKRKEQPDGFETLGIYEKLYHLRSDIPAVTHIDYSARIQTVSSKSNKRYWSLIKYLQEHHDCPLVLNTSFNIQGEPIVCSPDDGYRCFINTEMDYLVMGDYLVKKEGW